MPSPAFTMCDRVSGHGTGLDITLDATNISKWLLENESHGIAVPEIANDFLHYALDAQSENGPESVYAIRLTIALPGSSDSLKSDHWAVR